ncbi:aspartic peptidase domain-containing protein [Aspergillus karnatakaensis]|uniref:aspartic peptidase domain-containing protein n=1 Tax=Aspergillus karnatakaensis TaxID=1810916 RepID=UPI003CCCDD56
MRRLLCATALLWGSALLSVATGEPQPTHIPAKRDVPAVVSAKASFDNGDNGLPFAGYWVNVSIGTPPQSLAMILDLEPGYQTYVMNPLAAAANCSSMLYCPAHGYFKPEDSSSFEIDQAWSSAPEGGGQYTGTDVFKIGEAILPNISFGVEARSDVAPYAEVNILDISSTGLSLPHRLFNAGLTTSPSFSLWNNPSSNDAEVLFGGINTAKYNGTLQNFPTLDLSTGYNNYTLTLPVKGFKIHLGSDRKTATGESVIAYDFNETAFSLNIRSKLTSLPVPYAETDQFYADLGIPEPGTALDGVNCGLRGLGHNVELLIGDMAVSVPWESFFVNGSGADDRGDETETEECRLLLRARTFDHPRIKGDMSGEIGAVFLRGLYVAVDYESRVIGVAQVNRDPGEDNVIGFRLDVDGGNIPGTHEDESSQGAGSSTDNGEEETAVGDDSTGGAAVPTAFWGGVAGIVGGIVLGLM